MERAKGWPIVREKLNVTLEYLQYVTEVSKAPRHGSRETYIQPIIIEECINRAWEMMRRYIAYLDGGSQQLSEDEFPILGS